MPKLSLNLRGIACIETDSNIDAEPQWKLLNRDLPMNRADGSGRARVFVETAGSQLYEGPCLVGKLTSRTLPLRDLHGWGDPLIVRAEDQSLSILVGSVEDRGCVGLYVGSLFGKPRNEIHFRSPIPHSTDHQILVWSDMHEDPRRVTGHAISSDSDGFIWKLPDLGNVTAIALSYRGAWIGSYWKTDPMIRALRQGSSSKLFALLRWLKLPVLNPSFKGPMGEAIARAPAEFVSGWLGNEALPYSLLHRQAEQDLQLVIRAFLWNYAEKNEAKTDRLARAFPRPESESQTQSEAEAFKSSVLRLGEVCPSLAYNLARHKLRGDKYRKYVRAVAATLLRQSEVVDLSQLNGHLIADRRDCAKLVGLTPETLEANVNAFGIHLDDQAADYRQAEPALRRLGERSRGRQFLTASLLLRLLERSRF
ncbi:MAG TPA: hypothetical protein VNH83_21265, partial [Bryobacteraceae bacterium]|nr:hypothetical protein [Bryobacteraceae bacterium]